MAGRTTFLNRKKLAYCIPSFDKRIKTLRQKEPFFSNKAKNQSHSFSQTKIAASLNPQNLWLLLNAWKAPLLSLNLSGKKVPVVDHQGAVFYYEGTNSFDWLF